MFSSLRGIFLELLDIVEHDLVNKLDLSLDKHLRLNLFPRDLNKPLKGKGYIVFSIT